VSSQWHRQVDPSPDGKSFRASTKKFGVWVELHIFLKGIEAIKISSGGTESVTWNQNCQEKKKVSTLSIQKNKNVFTDDDLESLIKKNEKGMLYIWSPGMVYSMDSYPVFKNAAAKLNLPLTVLMDPYFDEERGAKIAKDFKIPYMNRRVESVELLMRNISTHYPETLIYCNGKLSYQRIIGAMTPEVLEDEIKASLKALND
jgi:hypothetical protein